MLSSASKSTIPSGVANAYSMISGMPEAVTVSSAAASESFIRQDNTAGPLPYRYAKTREKRPKCKKPPEGGFVDTEK